MPPERSVGRTLAHIGKEILEFHPAVADFNGWVVASVPLPADMIGVGAPSQHIHPTAMRRCTLAASGVAINCFELVADSCSTTLRGGFPAETSARACVSVFQIATTD